MLLVLLSFLFLDRELIQRLLIWSAQRRHVNLRMWMKTVVTVFLYPTSRFTTITFMTSWKALRLTQSDQSKGQDSKSACFLKHSVMLLTAKLVWIGVVCRAVLCEIALFTYLSYAGTPSNVHNKYFASSRAITSQHKIHFVSHVYDVYVHYDIDHNFLWAFLSVSLLKKCTFKNPVFGRWLSGGTPVGNNEFMYVDSNRV